MALQLPVTIEELGDPIYVRYGDTDEDVLGYSNQSTGEIVLREGLSTLGELAILIHEALHLVEASARDQGVLSDELPHEFVRGAAFMVAAILAKCGTINGLKSQDVAREIDALGGKEGSGEDDR